MPGDLKGSRKNKNFNESKRYQRIAKYNTSKWLDEVDEAETKEVMARCE